MIEGRASLQTEHFSIVGSDDPTAVACGHSHAAALMFALQQGMVPDVPLAVTAPPLLPNLAAFTEEYWDLVARAGYGTSVAVMWQGNQHLSSFLVQGETPFWIPDDHVAQSGAGVAIPQAMARELFKSTLAPLDEVVERLSANSNVLLLGTPPPKSDRLVKEYVSREEHFVNLAAARGLDVDELPLAPEALRCSLWRLLQEAMAQKAADLGVRFVSVPERALTMSLALRDDLAAPDATHANVAFGEIMWREIADSAAGGRA